MNTTTFEKTRIHFKGDVFAAVAVAVAVAVVSLMSLAKLFSGRHTTV